MGSVGSKEGGVHGPMGAEGAPEGAGSTLNICSLAYICCRLQDSQGNSGHAGTRLGMCLKLENTCRVRSFVC